MAHIEKRHDKHGELEWARGAARDIYRDEEVMNSRGVYFRVSGQPSRWFCFMGPRHMATWETEGPPTPERLQEVYSNLPPFKQWHFVLLAYEGPQESYTCLAQEVSGDQLIEVAVSRTSQPVTG